MRVHTVLISAQHAPEITQQQVREAIIEHVILPVLPPHMVDREMKIYVNPTGRFVIGGPLGDAGVTGRKIIVDTYGGMGRHGGGASAVRTPQRWIAQVPMRPAMWPRTSSPPGWPNAVRSRCLCYWCSAPVEHQCRNIRHRCYPG